MNMPPRSPSLLSAARPAPVSYLGALLVTGRGLVAGWVVGLLGWGLWQVVFQDINSLGSLTVLALVVLLAHIAFANFALGHMPRLAREQQRLFEHASKPMLQANQHQLTQLRAQKAVMESGQWEAGSGTPAPSTGAGE
jgi:hypothetical protein